MEVHHPHSPTEKRFKHYLFEFLMLFLAVFAGFIAENQREHFVEKKRTKTLVASLIVDLQKDTIQINELQKFRETKKRRLDSFYMLLHTPQKQIDQKTFYYLLYKIQSALFFSPSSGTISQLKNAGYLRYFSDSLLLHHISDYDFLIQDFRFDESFERDWIYNKLAELSQLTFDNTILDKIYMELHYPEGVGIPQLNPEVLHRLKAIITYLRYLNHVVMFAQNKAKK